MNRDIDGYYFRAQRDGKRQNLCFSDLTEEEMNITNKEAIKELECIKERGFIADAGIIGTDRIVESIKMSIEALRFKEKLIKNAKLLLSSEYNERHCKMFWIELMNMEE